MPRRELESESVPLGPFKLEHPSGNPIHRAMVGLVQMAVEKTLAFDELNRLYFYIQSLQDDRCFSEKAMEALNVTCKAFAEDLSQIPVEGPVIVVANHPFGGLEGLVLETLLRRVRPDVKLFANYMLHIIPDLRESFLFVDPFGKPESARKNMASMRAAIKWVRDGGALGVFPAGEVSHHRTRSGHIVDPDWSSTVSRLVQITGAPVVPVFFEGRNSGLFRLLGLVHSTLRTLMLPREMLKKKHSSVQVRIGRAIPPEKLKRFEDVDELTGYLRVRTYILRNRASEEEAASLQKTRHHARPAMSQEPVAPAKPAEELVDEFMSLPAEQVLADSGQFRVAYFRASQARGLLHEIGRLREIAFREVGEGTGKALDLDRFDEYYIHLIVWHMEENVLVGAYRMGPTDEILANLGKQGLYTSTLFNFKESLLQQISPALELGRSFVRVEYQRNHSPLMLLWKGLGQFACHQPRYRMFFGPVSISNEYQSVSKQLLMAFLKQNHALPNMTQFIKPRSAPHFRPIGDWSPQATSVVIRDLAEVDDLIAEIESDMKAVPILLRQYLKLNAQLLGFNVDPDFADVLDALLLVDLTAVRRDILNRYMGRELAGKFLAHHEEQKNLNAET